jgi:hypothetical protein
MHGDRGGGMMILRSHAAPRLSAHWPPVAGPGAFLWKAARNRPPGWRPRGGEPHRPKPFPFSQAEEHAMSDNKQNVDGRDRSRVSGSDRYEVRHFAEKHGISADQARELIEQHGNDRETLDRAAQALKG